MVNQNFLVNFHAWSAKRLGENLAGPPTILHGGVAVDHYRGLSSTLKAQVIPFHKESYQPTEFIYGSLPLRDPAMPLLFFQIPVLDVKGKNIPGVGQFATFLNVPIPETIVTPMVGLTHRYLPMGAIEEGRSSPKEVFKNKVRWTPLLEALNNEKSALKANTPKSYDATMGNFKVSVDLMSPIGLTQLAPYKGFTIITGQRPPSSKAGVNEPIFDVDDAYEKFRTIGQFVARHPLGGEPVGKQIVAQSNAAMMDLVFKHLDQIAQAAPPPPAMAPPAPVAAPPPSPAVARPVQAFAPEPPAEITQPALALPPEPTPAVAPAAPDRVPCPTCGGGVGIGWRYCPHCKQELVWG